MISKANAKFITSLQRKKVRDEEKLFVIEGDKIVRESLLSGSQVKMLIAKPEFLSSLSPDMTRCVTEISVAGYEDLKHISSLKTPHNAVAVLPIPELNPDIPGILSDYCVALDFIQDPGNLGTIIRAAGWFGFKSIICSENCVDFYNPKTIQASMGAFLHVGMFKYNLKRLFATASELNLPIFGTSLTGDSIYNHMLDNKGIILFGNESKGISDELMPYITQKIMIPRFGIEMASIDSLNVGMAASVVFSEFARRNSGSVKEP